MKSISIVSGNPQKLKEYQKYAALQISGVVFSLISVEIPELQSNKTDDVLQSKIAFVKKLTEDPFLVEDTKFVTKRYAGFPGTYVKFINETLGIPGWKKLFEEGDEITATTTLCLHSLGKDYIFEGELKGVLSFKNPAEVNPHALLNSLFYVPKENGFLGDLVKNENFINHRGKAMAKLFTFLADGALTKDVHN